MPYVPPHKKQGANASDAATSPVTSRPPSDRPPEQRPAPSRSGYGDGPREGLPRPASYNSRLDSQDSGARPGGGGMHRSGSRNTMSPVETVWPKWTPSDRVLAMGEELMNEVRTRLKVSVEVGPGQEPAAPPIEAFSEMNLHENIIADIITHKYETPTPIQCQGIPIALSGRDILGCAETGSGKTASFAIPMIQHVLAQHPLRPGDGPIALVLAPTRELAQQIEREVRAFSLTSARQVRTCIVVGGGATMQEQRRELVGGVQVVVATPGRFIDHLQQGNTNLARITYVVLDEADRMLDMGFEPQIKEVMNNLPPKHQTLLFSATMPKEIEELARSYLRNPVTVKIGTVSTPTANVSQSLERTEGEGQKLEYLIALLSAEMAAASVPNAPPMPLTVVFSERKSRCDDIAEALCGDGIPAVALHGGMEQRDRENALRRFSAGEVRVLVATDVASRGLDIKGIGHVINLDLPKTFEDYVHRIGRTGRAGTKGRATSFWTDRDSFLVSQIKTALSEAAKGNGFSYAAGREARKEERLLAKEFKNQAKLSTSNLVGLEGSAGAVKVDDKYAHMAAATAPKGVADAAWDD